MEFSKLTLEEIEKRKKQVYQVIISDSVGNSLCFNLLRHEIDEMNIFAFVELGFTVVFKKLSPDV